MQRDEYCNVSLIWHFVHSKQINSHTHNAEINKNDRKILLTAVESKMQVILCSKDLPISPYYASLRLVCASSFIRIISALHSKCNVLKQKLFRLLTVSRHKMLIRKDLLILCQFIVLYINRYFYSSGFAWCNNPCHL